MTSIMPVEEDPIGTVAVHLWVADAVQHAAHALGTTPRAFVESALAQPLADAEAQGVTLPPRGLREYQSQAPLFKR